ncbi:hypothetical protein E0H22_09980 [Rhodopseudomonas boonkerdii]|uniref:hypothetical protein n=1 Tax=Rhodopseudomonas boonkerdii TaxID=475937 RepID=UPI001E3B57CD|nr:hypothetical protein [Rhodopseudomonas boonkerdii]UGV25988.1 hypothetical protein E0H22_09980 [Rhodopseudomonas boonkerdii]
MTTILFGECAPSNLFEIWDPDAALETEFELIVAKALMCIYPQHHCFPFGGTFRLEDNVSRPDIALVAKDLSHWFVIEVELVSHSLEGHVLPQIRTFRYGTPQPDCISVLSKALSIDRSQIRTFLLTVPRTVAVVANKRHRDWEISLRSHEVQLLTVSAFNSSTGVQAVEVDGKLIAKQEHIAFGQYLATDRAIRFHQAVQIPNGEIMVDNFDGSGSIWVTTRDSAWAWVTKKQGTPDIPNGAFIQIVRTFGGRFSMLRSPQ